MKHTWNTPSRKIAHNTKNAIGGTAMNTITVAEARERLNLLKDTTANPENRLTQGRAYEFAFRDYYAHGIVRDTLKKEPESAGGYLVPDTMESRIVDKLNQCNVLRRICTVMQTTQDMNIPIVASRGQAFWVPEGGTLPVSDDQFNKVLLGAHKLGTSEVISSELLEESVIDMEKLITDTFAVRIADTEEDAFLNGDGNGKPTGLLTQAAVGATTENAGAVSLDDVIDLIYSVKSGHRDKGVLLMNDATLYALFKIKNAYDKSVWRCDFTEGVPDSLFGYPIVLSDAMPNVGSGSKPIAFGDFSRFWIGDRGHHHLKRLGEIMAKTDQVEYLLTKRVDAKLVVPEAVKTLRVA